MIALELCLQTETNLAANVSLAREFGVARLELCSRMDLSGLTPSPAEVAVARQHWGDGPGLVAMLRPRGGDFCYDAAEVALLRQHMAQLAAAGADSVVLGLLTAEHQLHQSAIRELVEFAAVLGLTVAFHRAIDASADPALSWLQLSRLGVARVLSAGTPWHSQLPANQGIAQLQAFLAAGGPELVIGGGVNAGNIGAIRAQLPEGSAYSFHLHSAVQRQGRLQADLLQAVFTQLSCPLSSPLSSPLSCQPG
ncbi:copper homeostasis protein CutC [Rheinheimera sp.]|uniref:copper homeostasis protein CutC n=1 Tax=Rheinheimera sp. TaxID=1869214 RepID=UPI003D2CCBD4